MKLYLCLVSVQKGQNCEFLRKLLSMIVDKDGQSES